MSNNKKLIFCLLIFFILTAYTSMHVPLHSDDFHYLLKGISIDSEIKSYMTWSGRVVADMLSPLLLNFLPVKLIGILNAACIVTLILLISMFPNLLFKEGETSYLTFSILFMLYWIANPSLGETSFWIVGSVNYLWTNLFTLAFFCFMVKQEKDNFWVYISSLVLGFLSGCANENTAPIITFITITFSLYAFRTRKLKFGFAGLLGNLIGASILLLSPGSSLRAASFTEWKVMPLKFKIFDFASNSFEHSLEVYWAIFIIVAIFMIIASLSVNISHSTKHLKFSLLFLIIAILSNCAFALSPIMPDRSLNGGLVFMLISTSFIFSSIKSDTPGIKSALHICIWLCLPFYALSYYLFTNSVIANYYQSKIRNDMINNQKNAEKNVVNIPSLYFTHVLKKSDPLNSADGKGPMATLFGVKDITYTFPDFDYSQIRRASYFEGKQTVYKDLKIERIYFYRENLLSGYKLIVQFNQPLSTIGEDKVFLHIKMKDQVSLGADIGNKSFFIDGKNLAKSRLGFYNPNDISSLTFGVYTLPDVKVVSEQTANISDFKMVQIKKFH